MLLLSRIRLELIDAVASIAPSLRCSSPQVTTCSTASNEVRKASAVSFQDSRRAPRNFLDDDRLTPPAIDTPHGGRLLDLCLFPRVSPQGCTHYFR